MSVRRASSATVRSPRDRRACHPSVAASRWRAWPACTRGLHVVVCSATAGVELRPPTWSRSPRPPIRARWTSQASIVGLLRRCAMPAARRARRGADEGGQAANRRDDPATCAPGTCRHVLVVLLIAADLDPRGVDGFACNSCAASKNQHNAALHRAVLHRNSEGLAAPTPWRGSGRAEPPVAAGGVRRGGRGRHRHGRTRPSHVSER